MITDINERSQYIFKQIVDSYMRHGTPVGSKTLSEFSDLDLSPASIRNIMAELEDRELLYAPHVSSGRLPTQKGLRFYIDGLMEVGGLSMEQQQTIDEACQTHNHNVQDLLDETSGLLSGLSNCASLVMAPKTNKAVKQIQFVKIQPRKVLVILVMREDEVENRILELDEDVPQSSLDQAGNFLNHRLEGKTLDQAYQDILDEIHNQKSELDDITGNLIEKGLAMPFTANQEHYLFVKGQSRLLSDVKALEELEKAKEILAMLEEKETTANLLNSLGDAKGVQIFIGTENDIFTHSGWSVILSPYKSNDEVIGAIGVIGPMRINYGKIIPIVDYTYQITQKILEN